MGLDFISMAFARTLRIKTMVFLVSHSALQLLGESITYTWKAMQYGTTWYHSHFALQAWEGVLGGIVINGPASGNYDEDLGNLFLNDWSTFQPIF